jgi:hypothetical protein
MIPHRAQERRERDLDVRREVDLSAAAQVERAQVGIGEVVGQRAELGQLDAPPPLAGRQVEDLDAQSVTRTA